MSGKTLATSETKIEALKLQSSAYGVVIPLVYGVTQVSGNLIWYGGFKAVPSTTTQGGKGGVKAQSTTYSYQASVAMGLCHGVIAGIPRVWRGKRLFSGSTAWDIRVDTQGYNVPASGAMSVALTQGATYVGMVQVTCNRGSDYGIDTLGLGVDYTVAAGVLTVLSEQYRGLLLDIVYQYTLASVSVGALDEMGLSFKAGALGQSAWSPLASYPDENIAYSGLAYVAGQDYDLGTGAQVENHKFEVVAPMAFHLNSNTPDVDPSLMLRDVLTNGRAGASFPADLLDTWTSWSDYCVAAGLLISPSLEEQTPAAEVVRTAAELTNAGAVWSGGRLKMLPYADTAETGYGRTYTPNVTPVYDLNDDHFTPPEGSPPIRQRLKSPAERFNHVRVQFRNRATQYAAEIAEAKDETDISVNGTRSMPIVNAPWVCEPATAQRVAFNKMQRALHVCAEYEFQLPWHFALLEPMDLVTLTDTTLELAQLPTRITVIEENADGDLNMTSEDYPAGTASAALYPTDGGSGYKPDYNADPGNADAPTIFELPTQLATDTGLQIGVAVRGSGANWGGAQVWSSLDGTNYQMLGTVYGASRYGTLASAFTSTVDVQGLGTAQLISGSAADSAALRTLCYVGGSQPEYFAYQTANLAGAGAYTLAGLVRGAYGTPETAHAIGDEFVRVDERVALSEPMPLSLIGSTIYIKLCSFNHFGGGQQGLAEVAHTTYTITGDLARLPPGNVLGLAASGGAGAGRITWTPNTEGDYAETELRLGASWAAGTLLARIKGSSYPWTIATPGTYTLWVKHVDQLGNESATAATVSVTVDALGTFIGELQSYGQNLLPESDQMVRVMFAADGVLAANGAQLYNPNGADLDGPFSVDEPGYALSTYQLVGQRSKLVFMKQTGRHTGTVNVTDLDPVGNSLAGASPYLVTVPIKPGDRMAVALEGNGHRCYWRAAVLMLAADGVTQLGWFLGDFAGTPAQAAVTNVLANLQRSETVFTVPTGGAPAPIPILVDTFTDTDGTTMSAAHVPDLARTASGVSVWDVRTGAARHPGEINSGELGPTDSTKAIRLEAGAVGSYPHSLVPSFPVFLFLEGRHALAASAPTGGVDPTISLYIGGSGPSLEVTLYEGNACYASLSGAWYSDNYWNGTTPAAGTSSVKMGLWFDGVTAKLIVNGAVIESSGDLSSEGIIAGDFPQVIVEIVPNDNGDTSEAGLSQVGVYSSITEAQAVGMTAASPPAPPPAVALAQVYAWKYNTLAGEGGSWMFFGRPQLEVVAANTLNASPYSPGPVGEIGTSQLLPGTATDVPFSYSTADFTVTSLMGPVAGGRRRQQVVSSITYTALVSGSLFIEFTGGVEITTPATNPTSGAAWSDSLEAIEFGLSGTSTGGDDFYDGWMLQFGGFQVASLTRSHLINVSRRFDVVAGRTYTFTFGCAKFDTVIGAVFKTRDLSGQAIKR